MSTEVRHFVLVLTNYILSGFGAVCFLLSMIWGFSNVEYILGPIITIIFIINVFLILIPLKYHGEMIITQKEDGVRLFSLEINEEPDGFETMTEIRFKVVNKTAK